MPCVWLGEANVLCVENALVFPHGYEYKRNAYSMCAVLYTHCLLPYGNNGTPAN